MNYQISAEAAKRKIGSLEGNDLSLVEQAIVNNLSSKIIEGEYPNIPTSFISEDVSSDEAKEKVAKAKTKLDKEVVKLRKEREEVKATIARLETAKEKADSSTGTSERIENDIKSFKERYKELGEIIDRRIEEFSIYRTKMTVTPSKEKETVKEEVAIDVDMGTVNRLPRIKANKNMELHRFLMKQTLLAMTEETKLRKARNEKEESLEEEKKLEDRHTDRVESIIKSLNDRVEAIDSETSKLRDNLEAAESKNLAGSVKKISARIQTLEEEKIKLKEDIQSHKDAIK